MQHLDTQTQIKAIIESHDVVIFMKGTPQFPSCGFSALAIQILKTQGVKDFHSVNVLENNDIRQGIKEYSDWPTIPQIYIQQTFIGGSDILKNMHESGELANILKPILAKTN